MGLIDAALDSTVTVRRVSVTKDASRGPLAAWPSVLDGWPAHVTDTGGRQVFVDGQDAIVQTRSALMYDPGDLGDPPLPLKNGDAIDLDGTGTVLSRVVNVNRETERFSREVYLNVSLEDFAP